MSVLTLPPHTSDKTQPLDRSVFGQMKAHYNHECDSWMMKNPSRPLTVYQIAELAGKAWEKAATPENIKAGFKATGIWPYNRDIFSEADFLPSSITDRPDPSLLGRNKCDLAELESTSQLMEPEPIPVLGGSETSLAEMATPRATDSSTGRLQSMPTGPRKTPEDIRPYPKAQQGRQPAMAESEVNAWWQPRRKGC